MRGRFPQLKHKPLSNSLLRLASDTSRVLSIHERHLVNPSCRLLVHPVQIPFDLRDFFHVSTFLRTLTRHVSQVLVVESGGIFCPHLGQRPFANLSAYSFLSVMSFSPNGAHNSPIVLYTIGQIQCSNVDVKNKKGSRNEKVATIHYSSSTRIR